MDKRVLEIQIEMENDALVGDGSTEELVRILKNVANRIELSNQDDGIDFPLRDINGNKCGYVWLAPNEEEETDDQGD